jgi:hypothetical protein
MPTVTRKMMRLTEADEARIARLALAWGGPVKPLDRSAVVREALRRADDMEMRRDAIRNGKA